MHPVLALALAVPCLVACSSGGGSGSEPSGALLAVGSPPGGFAITGPPGGPFQPASLDLDVENAGDEDLDWSASATGAWLVLSASSGTLLPGEVATLTVSIDQAAAGSLLPGTFVAAVELANETNGGGGDSVPVELSVTGPVLDVSPATGFAVTGPPGGPFTFAGGSDPVYTLENTGNEDLEWSVSADEGWLGIPTSSGTLAPGDSTSVTVELDQVELESFLQVGEFEAVLAFTNEANGLGDDSVPVELSVSGPVLEVTPTTGFAISGPPGGPFVFVGGGPPVYTLRNTGNESLDWQAFTTDSWLGITTLTGTLDPDDSTTVEVDLDQEQLAGFPAGNFTAVLEITNETNGAGDAFVGALLEILAQGQVLLVEPAEPLDVSGPIEGPFEPAAKEYTITNVSEDPIPWEATSGVPWVDVAPSSGVLAPDEEVVVTLTVDQTVAGSRGVGLYGGRVDIVDQVSGQTERIGLGLTVELVPGTLVEEINQHGITWEFAEAVPAGQFANGDYWVLPPPGSGHVTIERVRPASTHETTQAGDLRIRNGSEVNPLPFTTTQGYDNEMYGPYKSAGSFDDALNVALDVDPDAPLLLAPGTSLLSSDSVREAGNRPQLLAIAVLTVLDAAPPPGSFRPAYCGDDKTIRWNESDLDYSRLARLPLVPSTPLLFEVEDWFQRPWVDHIPNWVSQYFHPQGNMPNYGREMADQIGTASLMLHMDFTNAEKRTLLIRLVQVGIDLHGIVRTGGVNSWAPRGGGHKSGRKWPILFAGLMLDDPDMSSIGFDPTVAFAEDDQTFYVRETSPGVYNGGYGGYGPQHVGMPEWGGAHRTQRSLDAVGWFTNPYRTCCTANSWWGQVLAAEIMGARMLWNHEALFDYMDRYRAVAPGTGQPFWTISWTPFPLETWDTYREDYR